MDFDFPIATQIFDTLANPLFVDSFLDLQVSDSSLLPIIQPKKYHKRVHWQDEDEGQPLSELFTYISNWDRTPIQVSYVVNNTTSIDKSDARTRILFYICLSFFVLLLAALG